ncbi:hypothetical protein ALC57_11325 [Trachymyrmex cornetzi]|uniref:Uncharacterized protein n=1 Tax=Trachymyrmex cornetzi TaxID=471704 RepID=A0A195DU73_9HYME|nr:hypothetical protein ALC57_11325 [Trachymyrmex cornetzi]
MGKEEGYPTIIVAPAIPSLPSKLHEANQLIETWNLDRNVAVVVSINAGFRALTAEKRGVEKAFYSWNAKSHCKQTDSSVTLISRVAF